MPSAWRLVAERRMDTAFSGEGSIAASGRWHHAGSRCVYVSSSLAVACLEVLVHSGGGRPVRPYVSFQIDIPDDLAIADIPRALLAEGWRGSPPPVSLQDFGSSWIRSMSSAVLRIPSAVSPSDFNFLLNPLHEDFLKIAIAAAKPFIFDERLLVGQTAG